MASYVVACGFWRRLGLVCYVAYEQMVVFVAYAIKPCCVKFGESFGDKRIVELRKALAAASEESDDVVRAIVGVVQTLP